MTARSLARSRLPVIATGVLSALMIALYFLADAGTTAQTVGYEGVGVLALVAVRRWNPHSSAGAPRLSVVAGDGHLFPSRRGRGLDRVPRRSRDRGAVSVDCRRRVPGRVRLAHRRDDVARSTSRADRVERRPRWPDRPGRIGAALLVHARGAGDARRGIDRLEQARLRRVPVRGRPAPRRRLAARLERGRPERILSVHRDRDALPARYRRRLRPRVTPRSLRARRVARRRVDDLARAVRCGGAPPLDRGPPHEDAGARDASHLAASHATRPRPSDHADRLRRSTQARPTRSISQSSSWRGC